MSASIGISMVFLIASVVCAIISFQSPRRPMLLPLSVILLAVAIAVEHAGSFH
jgi:uncharacterized membrane protein